MSRLAVATARRVARAKHSRRQPVMKKPTFGCPAANRPHPLLPPAKAAEEEAAATGTTATAPPPVNAQRGNPAAPAALAAAPHGRRIGHRLRLQLAGPRCARGCRPLRTSRHCGWPVGPGCTPLVFKYGACPSERAAAGNTPRKSSNPRSVLSASCSAPSPLGDILGAAGIGSWLSRLIAPQITAYAAQDGDVFAQLNALRSAQSAAESSGRGPSRVAGGRPAVRAWAIHGHMADRFGW